MAACGVGAVLLMAERIYDQGWEAIYEYRIKHLPTSPPAIYVKASDLRFYRIIRVAL
jgi:hypothetical protein